MRISHSQKVIKQVRETIESRQLFNLADKLLIGISDGKDSLAKLDCLFQAGYKNLHSINSLIHRICKY